MLLIKLLQKYNFSVDKTNISMRKLLFTDTKMQYSVAVGTDSVLISK